MSTHKTMEEAVTVAMPYMDYYNQYRVISTDNAKLLLTEAQLERLMKDPIRKHGPAPDLFYWWNVCTYMLMSCEQ